jgi:phosphatidylglycerol:prolipoprotein diacylglycerol transferase
VILAYYIQTLNPFIWQWGNSGFGIRWYGTAYLLGFIIAYLLMKRFIRTGRMLLPMEQLPDFVLFVAIFGVLIGGRLGEAILYRPGMFTNFSPPFPYWGLLKIQDGGMAAHGGIVGVFIATWFFARRRGYRFLNLVDCGAMVAPIGIFFGRIANFINGEVYGHISHAPWAVQFPTELIYQSQSLDARIRHLAGAVASKHPNLAHFMDQNPVAGMVRYLSRHLQWHHPSLATALGLHPQEEIIKLAHSGKYPFLNEQLRHIPDFLRKIQLDVHARHLAEQVMAHYPKLAGAIRNNPNMELINLARQGNTYVISHLRDFLNPRIPSQLIEASLEGFLLFLLCYWIGWRWKKEGIAAASFAVLYPIMRMIGEQFRAGDQPKLIFGHWISLGDIYSWPLLFLGLIFLIWAIRRPIPIVPTIPAAKG